MKIPSPSLGLLFIAAFLGGCAGGGGSTGMRVTGTAQQEQAERPVNLLGPGTPYIVHVDERERLVTIRNGDQLERGYHVTISKKGEETAAIKVLPNRLIGLRTADILEGTPEINNRVLPADPARADELAEIYRDPDEDSK